LLARGHTVEAWCPSTADQSYLPLSVLAVEHVLPIPLKSDTNGSSWGSRWGFRFQYMFKQASIIDKHCRECADYINSGGFDVLLVHPCRFTVVPPIGRYVSIPTVLYLQEPRRKLYESSPLPVWAALPPPHGLVDLPGYLVDYILDFIKIQKFRLDVRDELKNVQAYDKILVNSLFSRESVLRSYGIDSAVCYLGVDSEFFKPTHARREPYVVGVGELRRHKGLDRAVRAIGAIPKDRRPGLVWVGNQDDPSYLTEIKSLADTLGVSFIPKMRLSDSEMVDVLSRATAMIYTPRLEPFGFAPLEANACQTPVVAIAEGGVRETIVDGLNGFLVGGDNPKLLGDIVLRLSADSSLRETIGANARRHVIENWSWGKSIDCLEDILLSLSAQGSGKPSPQIPVKGEP